MRMRFLGLVVAVSATACGNASNEDDVAWLTQAVNICNQTVPTNHFVDGIPAYDQCDSVQSSNIWSNNGVDTSTSSLGTDWVQTQRGGGYQCTEFAYRYMRFRWGISYRSGNAQEWCDGSLPSTLVKSSTPMHGDLMVFAGGVCGASQGTGHIAVVDTVNTTAATVTFVEENAVGRRTDKISCATCYLHAVANNGSSGGSGSGGASGGAGAGGLGGAVGSGGVLSQAGSAGLGGSASAGSPGSGGASGGAGTGGSFGGNTVGTGGRSSGSGGFVGSGGAVTTGGTVGASGAFGSGGAAPNGGSAAGGVPALGGSGAGGASLGTGGASVGAGGAGAPATSTGTGGSNAANAGGEPLEGSCSCRLPGGKTSGAASPELGALLLSLVALVRRSSRSRARTRISFRSSSPRT